MSIVGLGLMGGSLGRALHEPPDRPRVVGWSDSEADRAAAASSGAFDEVPADLGAALVDAELVVLAVPLAAALALMEVVGREAPAAATITDVVSLKAPIAEAARAAGLGERWVGGHPMAGSEASGFGASRGDLYVGATVWTVSDDPAGPRTQRVHRFWRGLGARPTAIGAEEHDRLMARVSHLPQMTATALAGVLADLGIDVARLGPGGRDTTRLAGSSPVIWADLLTSAPHELAGALRALSGECARLAELVEARDREGIERAMRRAGRWRAGG